MGSDIIDVAIVGAGPYGLSLATHLKAEGVPFRIFGRPMQFWCDLPAGMFLKSLAFATNVYTPDGRLGFVDYSRERGLETVEPCAMADFARYGVWAQRWLVPEVEEVDVVHLSRSGATFELVLSDGRMALARRVVLAVGLTQFARMPDELSKLPRELASHTSHHRDYVAYAGKSVCVIGSGQSAFEAARLLFEAGARPQMVVREPQISFSDKMPRHRSWWQQVRRPQSGLGPGLKNWALEKFPRALHFVPDRLRVPFVKSHLGPQGAWWLRDRIVGQVPVMTSTVVGGGKALGQQVALRLVGPDGVENTLVCDHVVAGTGYVVDIDRLTFIADELCRNIRRLERGPALDRHFQSSVAGLYFVGFASGPSFGPLFRFVAGAAFTSRSLSRTLALSGGVRATKAVSLPGEGARAAR